MKLNAPRRAALLAALALSSVAAGAGAHVTYLLSEKAFDQRSGARWDYLLSPLAEGRSWVAILVTLAVAVLGFVAYRQIPSLRAFFDRVAARADSYETFTPWMLRLSLGVALIGAGASGFLVSPILKGYFALAGAQVMLGFCLMSGLLVVPAAFGALAIYASAFSESWTIIGSIEFAAIAVALIVLDNERPGLDDMLGLPKLSPFRRLKRWIPTILRVGVGVAMASMALYEKLLNPLAAHTIVMQYRLTEVVSVAPAMWVLGAGLIELALGILHIVGWKTRPVVGLTFIVLSLSFFYFKEDVASHVTLFGALSTLFILKGGPWSVDAWLEKNRPAKPAPTCAAS
jgi:uncharacterized membrane protein YphA (DoxX/SURF4 family)